MLNPLVFFLDDSRSMLKVYEIKFAGIFKVFTFETVEDLLLGLLISKPDVIVCDLIMPRVHGLEAVEKIRERVSGIPIIIATSMTGCEYEMLAESVGCTYWSKSGDLKSLKEKIDYAQLTTRKGI